MEKKRRKRKGTGKLVALAIILAVAAAIAAFCVVNGGINLKQLWHKVYRDYADEYFYENSSGGSFSVVGNGFAVLSSSELYSFNRTGEETMNILISFSQPFLSCDGDYGAAWDLGGNDVILFSDNGLIKRITTENAITSVTVNDRGYLCVCTDETGYGGAVTVYNLAGTALYKWYSGTAYLLNARMKGKTDLMVLTIGSEGSSLVLMKINDVDERARYTYDGIIIDADFTDGGVMAITDSCLISLTKNLEERRIYDFSDKHLDAYILSDSFTTVITANYQLGGERQVMTVSNDGNAMGEVTVSDEITSVSVGGDYVGILSGGVIKIYESDLTPSNDYECLNGVEAIAVRNDGSAIAAGAYAATSYRPEETN
jgi:hypothetical protein